MGDIKQTFTADIEDLRNKMAKIQAEYVKLKEKTKEVSQASAEGSKTALSGFDEQIATIPKMVAGFVSVTAAVGFVKTAYTEWMEEIKNVGRENIKLTTDILSSYAKLGVLSKTGPLAEFVQNAPTKLGVTRAEALAAQKGVLGAAPMMDTQKQLALMKEVLPLVPFEQTEDIQRSGEIAGRLGAMFPEKNAKQLANLAYTLTSLVGQDADKITNERFLSGVAGLAHSGATTIEGGLALGVQAIQEHIPVGQVENMFGKVNQPMQVKTVQKMPSGSGHPKPLSAEDKEKNLYAAAPAAERLRMLFEDPQIQEAVMGERMSGKIGGVYPRLTMEKSSILEASIKAREENAQYIDRATTLRTPIGRENLERHARAVRSDELKRGTEEVEGKRILAREAELEKGMIGQNFVQRGAKRYWNEFVEFSEATTNAFFGQVPGKNMLGNNLGAGDEATGELKKMNKKMSTLQSMLNTNQSTNAAQASRSTGRE